MLVLGARVMRMHETASRSMVGTGSEPVQGTLNRLKLNIGLTPPIVRW